MKVKKNQAAELQGTAQDEMEAFVKDVPSAIKLDSLQKKGIIFNALINKPHGAAKGPTADPKAGDQRRHWLAAPSPRGSTPSDLPPCRFTCPNSSLCFILDQHFPTALSWFA